MGQVQGREMALSPARFFPFLEGILSYGGSQMSPRTQLPREIVTERELQAYLNAHPEVMEYLLRMKKAQEVFGNFLRLTGTQRIVRDLAAGSTAEVELNGSVSRTDR